jgi:cell division septation protein DedD
MVIQRKSKGQSIRRLLAIICFLVLAVTLAVWGGRIAFQDAQDIPVIRAEMGNYKIKPENAEGKVVPYAENELYETINQDEKRELISIAPETNWEDDLETLTETTSEEDGFDEFDLIQQTAQNTEDDQQMATPPAVEPEEQTSTPDQGEEPALQQADVIREEDASIPEQILESIIQSQTYQIQLGALPSEQNVKDEWTRLQNKFPSDLSALTLEVQSTGSNANLFRLRAGPLSSYGEASELCTRLMEKGQDCLVVTK